MDLGDAGNAGKGLAAVIGSLAALRESLRPRDATTPSESVATAPEVTREQFLALTEALSGHLEVTVEIIRRLDRAERTTLMLADFLDSNGDLTKKQRRRLEKARKPVHYNTRSDAD